MFWLSGLNNYFSVCVLNGALSLFPILLFKYDHRESKINCCLASLGDDGKSSRICRVRSSQKGYQRDGYILNEVFAFENGYINKKKDNYHQVQDVLQLTNVHSSMLEVPDNEYKKN